MRLFRPAWPSGPNGPGPSVSRSQLGSRPANAVARADNELLWVRVTCDGDNVSVREATTEAGLAAASDCFTSSNFPMSGGFLGFGGGYESFVDNLTVEYHDGSNWQTALFEGFEYYWNYYDSVKEKPTHDAAGNLAYDGLFSYTYDAWNRLAKVQKAYRAANGSLTTTFTVATIKYDALGRRNYKYTDSTADWSHGYRYYYDGDRRIEMRNGTNYVLQQFVWGTQLGRSSFSEGAYTDELVQIGLNEDPSDSAEPPGPSGYFCLCEDFYWVLQDANYSVLGVVEDDGDLKERYEYTPYGERTIFKSAGSGDPKCTAPILTSQRLVTQYGYLYPHGLCDFGHQGLFFDKEFNKYYVRTRYLDPVLSRMMSPDRKDYVDGMNRFEWERSNPLSNIDPNGEDIVGRCLFGSWQMDASDITWANMKAFGIGHELGCLQSGLNGVNNLQKTALKIAESQNPLLGILLQSEFVPDKYLNWSRNFVYKEDPFWHDFSGQTISGGVITLTTAGLGGLVELGSLPQSSQLALKVTTLLSAGIGTWKSGEQIGEGIARVEAGDSRGYLQIVMGSVYGFENIFIGAQVGRSLAMDLRAPVQAHLPARSISEMTGGSIPDDALVHLSPGDYDVINPPSGRSYWFRYGDIKGLTPTQVETVIGPLAPGRQQGGARVMYVLKAAPEGVEVITRSYFTEYVITQPVVPSAKVIVQGQTP